MQAQQTDACSLWLLNRDMLDTISPSDYSSKEKEIMELLGGTRNVLKIILQNKTNLSHGQLSNVYQILKRQNEMDHDHAHPDSDEDTSQSNEPITIRELGEDSLANVYKFLNPNEQQTLSTTSRYLHIVSHSKKCLQFTFQATSITYRLHHFINMLCSMDPSDASFISTSNALCCWIKSVCDLSDKDMLHERHAIISRVLCHSRLLAPIISNLCTVQTDANTIKNLLFVMNIICEDSDHVLAAVNAHIIERVALLFDHACKFQLFGPICTLLDTLWNVDSVLNSAIDLRIFDVSTIRRIMDVLLLPWSTCKPRVQVFSKAISLVSHWLFTQNREVCDYDVIQTDFVTVCASVVSHIETLMDVSASKNWIFELEDGATVFLRKDITGANIHPSVNVFRIKRIIRIPSKDDQMNATATCTFLGTFIKLGSQLEKDQRPYEQITVPLQDIECISSDDAVQIRLVDDIMELLLDLIEWISWEIKNAVELEDMKTAVKGIKNIFITCQQQCPWFSLKNHLVALLHCNGLYWELLSDQIETEFTHDDRNVLPLLETAMCCHDPSKDHVESLCQSTWFTERVRDGWFMDVSTVHAQNKIYLLHLLLKYYHRDIKAYGLLCQYLQSTDMYNDQIGGNKKVEIASFVHANTTGYLLAVILMQIISNANTNPGDESSAEIWVLHVCIKVLGNVCFHSNEYKCLRDAGDELGISFNKCWWEVLQSAMISNPNESNEKTINLIREMNWFIQMHRVDAQWFATNITRSARAARLKLRDILTLKLNILNATNASAIQNILSVI
eukprot:326672_1